MSVRSAHELGRVIYAQAQAQGAVAGGGSPSEVKYGQVGRADESFIRTRARFVDSL